MSIKIKEKVFPKTNKIDDLQYDTEGLYSISHPIDADYISKIIKKFTEENDNLKIVRVFRFDEGIYWGTPINKNWL